jgi:hypothetical protein
MNQFHFLSFSTDASSNKVFTYKEALAQEDAHLFVEAMQKEVADHELQNHWTIPKLFQEPLSRFRLSGHLNVNNVQTVHLLNITLDCVFMAECNNGAQTTGKHTHQ